jgi:hypothetical protein
VARLGQLTHALPSLAEDRSKLFFLAHWNTVLVYEKHTAALLDWFRHQSAGDYTTNAIDDITTYHC